MKTFKARIMVFVALACAMLCWAAACTEAFGQAAPKPVTTNTQYMSIGSIDAGSSFISPLRSTYAAIGAIDGGNATISTVRSTYAQLGGIDAGVISVATWPTGGLCATADCTNQIIWFDGTDWHVDSRMEATSWFRAKIFQTVLSALETCSSSLASPTYIRMDNTGGSAGKKTKYCMCTYDGTTAAWQNIATGRLGTTTTCPDSEVSASATIDFASVAASTCVSNTMTLTGAAANDPLKCSYPVAIEGNLAASCFVSATNTVTFRLCNVTTGGPIDPLSGTFAASL